MSSQKIDQSRRGFLTAALFTREGRKQVRKKQVRSGLIPPGLDQPVINNDCVQCSGYCADSCSQEIIKIHPASHDLTGQPYLDFNINGCTFCMDCNTACPRLEKQDSDRSKRKLGKARLSNEDCYAWNNIVCMSCINSCEYGLIKFDANRKPGISLEACTGCGFCMKTCPASAIQIVA